MVIDDEFVFLGGMDVFINCWDICDYFVVLEECDGFDGEYGFFYDV